MTRWPAPPRRRSRSRVRRRARPSAAATRRSSTGSAGACSASTTATTPSTASRSTARSRIARTRLPDHRSRCRRSGRGRTSVQGRAVNSKLVYVGAADDQRRHRRHDDLEHVPHRLGRRVRALPQPRHEQPGRQLGDPVVRDARPGRRRRTSTSTTTPRASTSARARSRPRQPMCRERHQQQHRRAGLHDQHLRLGVLRGEGERAPQPHREQRLRVQRRAVGVPGQQRRVPRRPQHGAAAAG